VLYPPELRARVCLFIDRKPLPDSSHSATRYKTKANQHNRGRSVMNLRNASRFICSYICECFLNTLASPPKKLSYPLICHATRTEPRSIRTSGNESRTGFHAEPLRELGVTVLAISPQVPERLVDIKRRCSFDFPVASDIGYALARKLGILYSYDQPSRACVVERRRHGPGDRYRNRGGGNPRFRP
jgi:AhpC/TSA family